MFNGTVQREVRMMQYVRMMQCVRPNYYTPKILSINQKGLTHLSLKPNLINDLVWVLKGER